MKEYSLLKFDIPKAKAEGVTNTNIIDIVKKLGYKVNNFERMNSDNYDYDCALIEVELNEITPPSYLIPMPHIWMFDFKYPLT